VPVATPVTIPVEPAVATEVAEELHVPPVAASLKAVVAPVHTVAVPVMAPADAGMLTVTTLVALLLPQPLVNVNDIVAVPALIPVTIPVELTVAMPTLPELHTPPLLASLKTVVAPAHTIAVPMIEETAGTTSTSTPTVAIAVPQPFVTV
jgi:hypothetical protein